MDKKQLEKEIKTRTEILKSYLGEVQKIPNYRKNIECQSYFPTVNAYIVKMNKILSNCLSLADDDFKNLNFKQIVADLDRMMIEPKTTLEHIKARGVLSANPHSIEFY